MKLSKILMTVAAAAALVGFAGCKADSDDPNDMIKKESSKKYTIDYTNEDEDVSRGYQATVYKHTGGTVRIKFDASEKATGTMGFIWELDKEKDSKSFYVVGINYGYGENTGLGYYVSKYTNVTDIQAKNFGAKVNATEGPCETVVVDAFTKISNYTLGEDKIVDVVVDVVNQDAAGTYTLSIYDGKTYSEETPGEPLAKETGIAAEVKGEGANKKVVQHDLAVYANVYSKKTHSGEWEFLKDYNYAIVEE